MSRFLLLAVVPILLASSPSVACSCLPKPPIPEALEQADAVFAGRVVVIELVESEKGEGPDEDLIVTLRTNRVWKGVPSDRLVEVRTSFTCCLCGFDFEIGQEYLLYSDARDGQLRVSMCSRSKELAKADQEIEALEGIIGPAS